MSILSAEYVFGGNQVELDRLVGQAEDLKPEAEWLLGTIGVATGWSAVDIGCGPIGIMDLLAERVGRQGRVVGVERESRFAAMARHEIARRGLGNTRVVEGDALDTSLEPGTYDLVHERLVLINMPPPDQQSLLASMVRLARPGGTIAVSSWDRASFLVYPAHASFDALDRAYRDAIRATNGDGTVGRTLPALLRQQGLLDVRVEVHCRAVDIGERRRTHRLGVLESAKARILAGGHLTDAEFVRHKDELATHLADPSTLVIDQLLVQAWGKKPS